MVPMRASKHMIVPHSTIRLHSLMPWMTTHLLAAPEIQVQREASLSLHEHSRSNFRLAHCEALQSITDIANSTQHSCWSEPQGCRSLSAHRLCLDDYLSPSPWSWKTKTEVLELGDPAFCLDPARVWSLVHSSMLNPRGNRTAPRTVSRFNLP